MDIQTRLRFLALTIILTLTACGTVPDAATPTLASVTQTSAPPTATPVPLAVMVNGEGVTLAEFNAELARFQTAQDTLGKTVSAEEAEQRVLDDLINQVLLAQGARDAGYTLEDTEFQARLEALTENAGGGEALSTWLANHGYTDESFRQSLKRAIESAWMRDKIISSLPSTADQVHVQQILLYNEETADEVKSKLEAGADFGELASAYDPRTSGELSWFPQGYLLEAKIEEAAFALDVGQVSDVIATDIGFHLIMVLERDAQRPLSPDASLALQDQALKDWLQKQREQSTIKLLL
ncbi:MAG: hypothetical protein B6I38_09630 [Anaerolineaceae bacterium 4572_5.1]|nr:MAG: hypothetical protein B6I38_09630 [Anaerolineaceae bacterium 4572_5.1]